MGLPLRMGIFLRKRQSNLKPSMRRFGAIQPRRRSGRNAAAALFALFGTLFFSAPAHADCTFYPTGLNFSFGTQDLSSGAPIDRSDSLTLACRRASLNTRNCLSFDAGLNADGISRRLKSGSNYLRYQLYSDSARTVVWGSYDTGYNSGVTLDTEAGSYSPTIYIRILGNQQNVPPGSGYTDTIGYRFTSKDDTTTSCPNAGPDTSSSGTKAASATVSVSCTVSAATLNFGSYSSLGTAVDAASTVSVTCSSGSAYTVGLSAGNGSGATVAARKMTSGGNTVTYSLYRDSGRSQVWGTATGTDTAGGTGTGSAVNHTVYGRVPVQSTPPAGSYSDTVVVTVTY